MVKPIQGLFIEGDRTYRRVVITRDNDRLYYWIDPHNRPVDDHVYCSSRSIEWKPDAVLSRSELADTLAKVQRLIDMGAFTTRLELDFQRDRTHKEAHRPVTFD